MHSAKQRNLKMVYQCKKPQQLIAARVLTCKYRNILDMNAKNNPWAIPPCTESWADLLNYRGILSAGHLQSVFQPLGKESNTHHFCFAKEIMTNPICFLQTYKLFYLQSHVTKKNNNKAKNKKYNRSLENISRPGVEPWQYQSDTCLFWFSFFKL